MVWGSALMEPYTLNPHLKLKHPQVMQHGPPTKQPSKQATKQPTKQPANQATNQTNKQTGFEEA